MAKEAGKLPEQNSAPVSRGNSGSSFQVSLPQMLNLALGTPEVGAVNFNILHNFLQVVLHQINLRTTKVEYRGNDAKRMKAMAASLKDGPNLHLHEYSITDGSGKVRQRIHSNDNLTVNVDIYTDSEANLKSPKGSVSARTTRASKSKAEMQNGPDDNDTGRKKHVNEETEREVGSVIFVESVADVSLSYKTLENSVKKLQQQFQALEELASNPELIDKVKGNSTDPLTDMWQIINIKKRLDASEQGISKLTSILQDFIKDDKLEVQTSPDVSTQLTQIDQRLSDLEKKLSLFSQENHVDSQNVQDTTEKKSESKNETETSQELEARKEQDKPNSDGQEIQTELDGLKNDVSEIRNDIADLKHKLEESTKDDPTLEDIKSGAIGNKKSTTEKDDEKNTSEIAVGGEEEAAKSSISAGDEFSKKLEEDEKSGKSISPASAINGKAINDDELTQCLEAVQSVKTICSGGVNELNTRIEKIEKEIAGLMEATKEMSMNAVSSNDGQVINELDAKIQMIQTEVEKLNQTATKIIEDKENLSNCANVLQEQIELLRTVKADKEDLEDALASKADANTVSRKVSYDQFDATCDDLTRGLKEAIDKLNQQELVWQQALEEVQKDIENKLDKVEISPFKDSIDSKLKGLQDKMKTLLEIRGPNEAAATRKMLRDVQCLSCNKDVIMRVHDNTPVYAPALRGSKTMKPYLNHEFDHTRKQRQYPPGKNMHHLEAALKDEKKMRSKTLTNNSRNHLCNRYCGGSHTIITPDQKVLRTGNFVNQWGPQAIQLSDGLIQGTDGQMYRGRLTDDKSNSKEMQICDPCDNKCNIQQTPIEVFVSEPKQQNVQKKKSHSSEAIIEKVSANISIELQEKVSKESSVKAVLSEEPSPPPTSPIKKQSLDKNELQEDDSHQHQNSAEIMGVGSFFKESKSIAKIAFQEDEDEHIEDEDL